MIAGAGLGVLASLSPGVLQAYLIQQTAHYGWRRALPSVLAPLLSDLAVILLVVFLLTRVSAAWLRLIRAVGGCFMLYLAWEAYGALRQGGRPPPLVPPAIPRSFLNAVVANGLSAGPYIFWGVIAGPLLLRIWAVSAVDGAGFLLAYYVALIGTYALQVFFIASVSRIGPRTASALKALGALALLFMGLYQLWSGLTGA